MSENSALPEVPELLTARNLADLLQVDLRTIFRWVKSGAIPMPFRLGRCTRWQKGVIERFLANQQSATLEAATPSRPALSLPEDDQGGHPNLANFEVARE
jgi:predicted DNA-binding transcriptional regulator AlpA